MERKEKELAFTLKNFYKVLPKHYVGEGPIEYENDKYLHIDVPFTMCIVGPKGSFKTNSAANIRDAFGCFTKFYLFGPTLKQPIWQHMIDRLDEQSVELGYPVILYGDKISEVPPIKDFDKKFVNLLILDDMTTEELSSLNEHFTNGRHKRLSIMIICHNYFTLPKVMRRNIDLVVLKDIRNKTDLRRIFGEFYHTMDIDGVVKLYKQSTAVREGHDDEDRLNFFMMDNRTRDRNLKYRRNFTGIPVPKDPDEEPYVPMNGNTKKEEEIPQGTTDLPQGEVQKPQEKEKKLSKKRKIGELLRNVKPILHYKKTNH